MNPISKNIVITVALIVPWVASSVENIPYFKQIGTTRALMVNFNQEIDKDTIVELKKALAREKKRTKSVSSRQVELTFIEAQVHYAEGQIDPALKKLESIASDENLGEMAVYYAGVLRRKSGTLPNCTQARTSFSELLGKDSIFQNHYKREFNESSLCIVKNMIATRQKEEAKQLIPNLLSSWLDIKSADSEFLYKALLDFYIEDQQIDLARATILNAKTSLSNPSWVSLYEMNRPELKAPAPTPAETFAMSPELELALHKQKEAELFSKVDSLLLGKRHIEAILLIAKTIGENSSMEKSSSISMKLNQISLQYMQNQQDFPLLIGGLSRLPPFFQYKVARYVWEYRFDKEAAQIFSQVVASPSPTDEKPFSLYFLARIAEDEQNWNVAYDYLEKLVTQFPNSNFFKRSVFKLGLLSHLMQKEKDALKWLEHAYTLAQHPNEKAEACYWIYRTYLKLDAPADGEKYKNLILKESPISFYSLLIDKFPTTEKKSTPSKENLQPHDAKKLSQVRAFFSVGLLDFGIQMLNSLDAEQNLDVARESILFYNAVKKYRPSIVIAYNFIHKSEFEKIPEDLFQSIFPSDYTSTVRSEARKNNLDPELVSALIKQESAYEEKAISRSGALGLMQLMPLTAQHVASKVKEKNPSMAELLTSEKNIKLGAHYLKSLLDKFDGNLIFATAAYNAGPTKVQQWKKQWGNLPPEVFIEMIPFDETRGYVKLVMRNYAFYSKINKNYNHQRILRRLGS